MFGLPADAAWIWLGLLLGSAAMFGLITGLPTPSPDATAVTETVDDVAASPPPASASVEPSAEAVKLETHRVGLRGPGGTRHATYRDGPVVPVPDDSQLEAVLDGRPPMAVFGTTDEFRRAVARSRSGESRWRELHGPIKIRSVSFGEVECVLVGA